MSQLLLWAKTSAGGAKVLAATYVASADLPWGGNAVAGRQVAGKRLSLELNGVIDGATNLKVKITRTPTIAGGDSAMGAVDLSTTSHKEGNAGTPQPAAEHTYTGDFDDLVEVDLSDAPAVLNVSVKCAGVIGNNTAVRAYLRWL